MFDLYLRFKTFRYLEIFLLLAIASVFFVYLSLKRRNRINLTPFILFNVLVFLVWGILIGIDHDETAHLHCTWMISRGLIPFKDFWAHHSPFLWIILAPFFKILKPTALIFVLSRIFSAFIFTLIAFTGWKIAKKVLQERASVLMYLFVLFSASVLGEFLWLRSDLFMILFLLFGVYLSLEIPGKKLLPAFFSGIAFSLAASFIFKQYFLSLLPIIIIFLGENRLRIAKLLVYIMGLIIGSLPLLSYLIKNNILSEFIFWVFKFNRERIEFSVLFPIGIGCIGVWGAYLLLERYRKLKDVKSLILLIAFCLSILSSLTGMGFPSSGGYYLGFWYILCAIVSSGCNIMEIPRKTSPLIKRSLVLGLFLSLLLAQNSIKAMTHRSTYFSKDMQEVSELINYTNGDTCLVILPLHPVFSYDATRLYLYWQYYLLDDFPAIRKDAKNITQAIIDSSPAVVMYRIYGRNFMLELFQKKLITADDYKRLTSILKDNYTVKYITGKQYYIRNDKL